MIREKCSRPKRTWGFQEILKKLPPMYQKPKSFSKCQLAPPHPRITLSEQGSTSHFKHCAAAQRPWLEKRVLGAGGGLKIMIFMIFEISTKMLSQVGHQPRAITLPRGVEMRREWDQTIDLSMFHPGKRLPSKMNSGILQNFQKTTSNVPDT